MKKKINSIGQIVSLFCAAPVNMQEYNTLYMLLNQILPNGEQKSKCLQIVSRAAFFEEELQTAKQYAINSIVGDS